MGFRSNFITSDYRGIDIPAWFVEKYPDYSYSKNEAGKETFGFAQIWESKFYRKFNEDERFLDIQKVLQETNLKSVIIILLHECDGITRVKIEKDKITALEPTAWKEVEGVEHDYCYGCSDLINN